MGRLCKAKGVSRIMDVLNGMKSLVDRKIVVKIIGIWANDFSSETEFRRVKDKFIADKNSLTSSGKFDITI